jgi:hypothetical protein
MYINQKYLSPGNDQDGDQRNDAEDNFDDQINDFTNDAGNGGRLDTGSGAGGNDFVGQQTGNIVDDSIADTVAGGTTSGRTYVGAHADDATGGASGAGDMGSSGIGRETEDADPSNATAGPVSTTLSGESATITDEDRAAGQTGGSGAFTNDRGAHLDDIPTGTGSAQRGNRAGMEDNDEGTIIEG